MSGIATPGGRIRRQDRRQEPVDGGHLCQGMAATAEQSCRRGDAGTSRCRHASPACWPLPHAFRRPLPAMARTPQASCPLTWASPMHGACCGRSTVHGATAKTTRDWLHLRSSAMPPPRAARCSLGWYSMVTRFAECPDIVATPTWLEASMTSTGIFSRVPMAISVRNTGRRHLPCGADRVLRSSHHTQRSSRRALRLGAASRAHRRSLSAAVPALRRADEDRRLPHRPHHRTRDPRPPRRADPPTDDRPGPGPAAVRDARGRTGQFRLPRPARTGVRIRSTGHLVTLNADRHPRAAGCQARDATSLTLAPGATIVPRPRPTTPSPRRLGRVQPCYADLRGASGGRRACG